MPDALEMLHMGVSMNCMFNGNFKVEWAVLHPGSNVAAIPDDTRAKVMSFWNQIVARINLIRKVLPVPPGTSKKKIPPTPLSTFCIIWS